MTDVSDLYLRLEFLSKVRENSGVIDERLHTNAYATVLDAMNFVMSHDGKTPDLQPMSVEDALSVINSVCTHSNGRWSTDFPLVLVRAIEAEVWKRTIKE
jgi:hypothetical protein